MDTAPDDDVAADYLSATLVPRPSNWVRAGIDALLGSGVLNMYDVEIRRLDTQALVLRIPTDANMASHLLGKIELEMETLTVTAFLESWRPMQR